MQCKNYHIYEKFVPANVMIVCMAAYNRRAGYYNVSYSPRPKPPGLRCKFTASGGVRALRKPHPVQRMVLNFYYHTPLEMSKKRSKNFKSLARTVSRFFVRSPDGEKRDTGGNTLARSVPVVATLPLRNALRTNL